jgi:hypothetical protein
MRKTQEQFSAKKSIQKKQPPDATYLQRSSVLTGVAGRDFCPSGNVRHPCRTPKGLFPPKSPVFGAGITGMGGHRKIVGWIRRAKPLVLQISKVFLRVVIHQSEVHRIRRVTPRTNICGCIRAVSLRGEPRPTTNPPYEVVF